MTGPDHPASDDSHNWLDAEAGPVVRPYTLTGGRSAPEGHRFDMLSFVVAVPGATIAPANPLPEFRAILEHAREPISVAELASRLDLALGVVRVLLDDMTRENLISIHRPAARAGRPDDHILKAVINGLRTF